jgi:phenylpropionate dioxygenase-like ring-hydroxylating dioxygenase large terminal subunit
MSGEMAPTIEAKAAANASSLVSNGFLRNAWYPALWGDALRRGQTFARRILNEPLVFFRAFNGKPSVLVDACPHRFAPLHMGRVLPNGTLQCAYHGLEFDGSGACVRNPQGNGRVPHGARVKSYTVAERHHMLWVWMGESPANEAMIPDFGVIERGDPVLSTALDHIVVDANYLLIVDNLLDLTHLNYLHKGFLSAEDPASIKITPKRQGSSIHVHTVTRNAEISALLKLLWKPGGGRADIYQSTRWDAPGCVLITGGGTEPGEPLEKGTGTFGIHLLTPESMTTTHYSFAAVRWNPRSWGPERDARIRIELAQLRHQVFEEQDGALLRKQQANVFDNALRTLRPVFLQSDEGPMLMRRALAEMMDAERGQKDQVAVKSPSQPPTQLRLTSDAQA